MGNLLISVIITHTQAAIVGALAFISASRSDLWVGAVNR